MNKSPFEEVHSSRNKSISLANSLNSCQSVQDLRGSLNSGNNGVKDKGKIKLI